MLIATTALSLFLVAAAGEPSVAAAETAESIMAKVAVNQDRAEGLRSKYIFRRDVHVQVHGGIIGGKLMREEHQVYTIAPTPTGFQKQLMESTAAPEKAREIDRELAHEMADDTANEKKSRDGISRELFPLTAKEQKNYKFRLVGEENYHGRPVYHLMFEPVPDSEGDWKGDALIDRQEFQPVLVTSKLAWAVPRAIRIVLGTNIQATGFEVAYRNFAGQWFPETYTGEFRIKLLFLFNRRVGIDVRNTGVQRSEISSSITYQEP